MMDHDIDAIDRETKDRYAELIVKGYEPTEATTQLFPGEDLQSFAAQMAIDYQKDPYVREKIDDLHRNADPNEFTPTSTEVLNRVWREFKKDSASEEYKAKLAKILTDSVVVPAGKIDGGTNINAKQVFLIRNEIKDSGTFEEIAMKHQEKLKAKAVESKVIEDGD